MQNAVSTHDCCVLTWDGGFCPYPSALSRGLPSVVVGSLNRRQKSELSGWCHCLGVRVQLVELPVLGEGDLRHLDGQMKKWWTVRFHSSWKGLRR